MSTGERFLVTGALGCIGAWTCAELAAAGVEVVGFDLGADDRRVRLATEAEIPLVHGDISDREAVTEALDDHGITHVIHLAALLIPSIKRDPPYGTAVNIGGTVNVLDSAKTRGIRVAYASSAAVYSQVDDTGGPVANDAVGHPVTFYGVHKQTCEALARIFWQEEQVPSIGRGRRNPRKRHGPPSGGFRYRRASDRRAPSGRHRLVRGATPETLSVWQQSG